MKKIMLAVLILLLLALAFSSILNIPKVSATTTEDLHVDYGLPEGVPREPMPENYTTEDYLKTTNPYSDGASIQGALDEGRRRRRSTGIFPGDYACGASGTFCGSRCDDKVCFSVYEPPSGPV